MYKRFFSLRRLHIRQKIVFLLRYSPLYPYFYKAYWHKILHHNKNNKKEGYIYYTAKPNIGAGIGHQIANWLSGYHHAKCMGLQYVYSPFSNPEWESFLGFGEGEIHLSNLRHIKKRRLPLFDGENMELNRQIIDSYKKENVLFVEEQDQVYIDLFEEMEDMKKKFYNAPTRKENNLIYSEKNFNIAVHIRRGDIVRKDLDKYPNLSIRYQNNSYFINVLKNVLKIVQTQKTIHIYLFSQGKEKDFVEFKQFPNIVFCLEMSPRESFLNMVYADILITSKSGFSYIPALLSNNMKICPKNFWHGYPQTKDWVLADEQGNLI